MREVQSCTAYGVALGKGVTVAGEKGVDVSVNVAVLVGLGGITGVLDDVGVDVRVDDGVCDTVQVGVGLAVDVVVGVNVLGRKGVFDMVGVIVSVGVNEAVPVRISGVWLAVVVNRLNVSVMVEVIGVIEGVGVMASGSGANCTAIQPRQ
jgi:hypothetical protein